MKSGFIRTLWGIMEHNGRRMWKRREKIEDDISFLKINKYSNEFRTYVFGEDNFKQLEDRGIKDLVLIDKRPVIWDMETQQFRHKIEAWKYGMNDFDEIVFLDWDCVPVSNIPEDFWEELRKKQKIQAILRRYVNKKVFYRPEPYNRMTSCASFVYMKDKKVPEEIIKLWEEMGCPWSEEVVLSKYIDDLSGGWKGIEYYWENFEPNFFNLMQAKVFDKELTSKKRIIFDHFNYIGVRKILRKNRIKITSTIIREKNEK